MVEDLYEATTDFDKKFHLRMTLIMRTPLKLGEQTSSTAIDAAQAIAALYSIPHAASPDAGLMPTMMSEFENDHPEGCAAPSEDEVKVEGFTTAHSEDGASTEAGKGCNLILQPLHCLRRRTGHWSHTSPWHLFAPAAGCGFLALHPDFQ